MTQSTNQARRSEGGFTLVELAIVMIIIGLLIGGILKGQELITNARVSSTVAQLKAVESGISGFRDKYAGLPGDIRNVTNRLPNATAGLIATDPAAGATPNDGQLSTASAANTFNIGGAAVGTAEGGLAFLQLGAAGFIGGVNSGATDILAGDTNPTTPLGGALTMGSFNGAATGLISAAGLAAGVYAVISPNVAAVIPTAAGSQWVLTPAQASTIDQKLDDGQPNAGSVRAMGIGANGNNCASAADTTGIYQTALGASLCSLAAKVQ